MYAAEAVPTINAKSYIQALLKTREQLPSAIKSSFQESKEGSSHFNHLSGGAEYSELGITQQNLEYTSKVQCSSDHISSESQLSENCESQKDFNYSQKLFHIADGNLYSIFSPIQGRSYGMKPSFLRKQKYTVQECHNRGRKNLRKGLKFHNFLPSESVTSEKDNGYRTSKWKVHSECRLREEHGTKQITISNWSQSVQNPSDDSFNYGKTVLKRESSSPTAKVVNSPKQRTTFNCAEDNCEIDKAKMGDIDPYDFNLSLQSNSSSENSNISTKVEINCFKTACKKQNLPMCTGSKKESLNCVLNSLIDRPNTMESKNINCKESEMQTQSLYHNQKHRRKPVQTRRIVPYMKYLSIIEESESLPLDLSTCTTENSNIPITAYEDSQNVFENNLNYKSSASLMNCVENFKSSFCNKSDLFDNLNPNLFMSDTSNDIFSKSAAEIGMLQKQKMTTPVTFLCPLPVAKNLLNANPNLSLSKIDGTESRESYMNSSTRLGRSTRQNKNMSSLSNKLENSNIGSQSLPSKMQYAAHKSFVQLHSKTRRRNQRSVIKQKLEDTFRQNGFLVKTKQVSDGEATFCKFRQLRKYTRYYLKSWQQHLPDEVHKMWKGFLPPKTVLPPVSSHNVNSAIP